MPVSMGLGDADTLLLMVVTGALFLALKVQLIQTWFWLNHTIHFILYGNKIIPHILRYFHINMQVLKCNFSTEIAVSLEMARYNLHTTWPISCNMRLPR